MNRHWLAIVSSLFILACGAEGPGDGPSGEAQSSVGAPAAATCGSACAQCVLAARTDVLPFYQRNGWDTSCGNRDAILANWCSIDPSGCASVKNGTCAASCGAACGSACTQCVLARRTDILPFYQRNGWDTSCGNRDRILANWCSIDASGCATAKSACGSACGANPPTVDPYCTQSCGCDSQGKNCNFGSQFTDGWCRCCLHNCGGNKAACDQQGYAQRCTPHFTFCQASCGCNAMGESCNFGTQKTDPWCKCCAENCGGNQAACGQQGYKGDQGFPQGTSRQCGCLQPVAGSSHDFTLADNANLGTCYANLRGAGITAGYQTIWHPGASECSSGQHMHILAGSASGLNAFGIDCLGQSSYNGASCTSQTNIPDHAGATCWFLWQGAQ